MIIVGLHGIFIGKIYMDDTFITVISILAFVIFIIIATLIVLRKFNEGNG